MYWAAAVSSLLTQWRRPYVPSSESPRHGFERSTCRVWVAARTERRSSFSFGGARAERGINF
ncbi:hypothetical protein N9L68_05160 [bacterium]|nr:hypothetical protein [bacterium]